MLGVQAVWDLGRFTYRNYIQHNFLESGYKRQDVYVQASSSDRTLMSASAWGQTAFPRTLLSSPASAIPVATYSVPMTEDDLLEVRKSRCLARLTADVQQYDRTHGPKIVQSKEFNRIVDKISEACGHDLRLTPNITNGEFTLFDAIKDVSDAISGDFLEGFPRMGNLSDKDAVAFLQLAEDLFQHRLYSDMAQSAYLSGKLPEKIQNIFGRHVALSDPNGNAASGGKEDLSAFGKLRAPRKLFSYHCHREVLYGIAKFLGISTQVTREGLPNGLIHPGTGFFFELWEDSTTTPEQTAAAGKSAESRFTVRVLLWVPCWKGDGVSSIASDGEVLCPARVRVLPQCGKEFCPLEKFNEIILSNFRAVGGDYRKQCPRPASNAEALLRKQVKQLQSKLSLLQKATPAATKGGRGRATAAATAAARRRTRATTVLMGVDGEEPELTIDRLEDRLELSADAAYEAAYTQLVQTQQKERHTSSAQHAVLADMARTAAWNTKNSLDETVASAKVGAAAVASRVAEAAQDILSKAQAQAKADAQRQVVPPQ